MTAFTVWKFNDPDGATRAESTLQGAASDGLVEIVDHLVLSWPPDQDQPDVRHRHSNEKEGAVWGGLWGVVLGGVLFTVPVAGAVVGAGLGALAKRRGDASITDADLERIRTEITPGTSALFLVTEHAELDRLGDRFRGHDSVLVSTNLTDAERSTLLEALGGG